MIAVSCYERSYLARAQRPPVKCDHVQIEGNTSFLLYYQTLFKGLDLEPLKGLK
jgi:hypothetical protein